ncbi:MAG: SGNH hydrolase domain-containing protein, partial [Solirubrobacteraceae bacterium]
MRSPRVSAIDLTRFFCDPQRCFPVIGGASVYKDVDHISAVYARSLGPFLLRAYDAILGTAPDAGERPAREPGPLDILVADERAGAECLLSERLAASQAGGFQNVAPERRERADACRVMLEQRTAQLRAAGLTGERNRRNRHALILAVLET